MLTSDFRSLGPSYYGTARSQKAVTPSDDNDLPDGPCAALLVTADGDINCLAVDDAGVNEVQTVTLSLITGGTFTLSYGGSETAAIEWISNNDTLLANIQAAVNVLPTLGNGWVVFTDSTLTAGLGDILATFSGGGAAKRDVDLLVADTTDLEAAEGDTPDITIVETTPGIAPEDIDDTAALAGAALWAGQVAGQVIPVQIRRVMATSTTGDVMALY